MMQPKRAPETAQRWRIACQHAFFELDQTILPQRIADARSAIFDRAEEVMTQPASTEHRALNNALRTLRAMEEMLTREKPAA